jgi:hypothetical protein
MQPGAYKQDRRRLFARKRFDGPLQFLSLLERM